MNSSAEETWKEADVALEGIAKRFAEVREHGDEALAQEQAEIEAANKSAKQAEEEAKSIAETMSEASSELDDAKPVEEAADVSSSFMEIPDSLAKFPKVAEDMKAMREAEQVFAEKMRALKARDNELMEMAQKNFAESRNVVKEIGNFRKTRNSGSSSFLERAKLPPAFERILKAEADLKAVNDQLARDFNFA